MVKIIFVNGGIGKGIQKAIRFSPLSLSLSHQVIKWIFFFSLRLKVFYSLAVSFYFLFMLQSSNCDLS